MVLFEHTGGYMSKADIRRQQMLQYIKKHKTVTTSELQDYFNIRKASLSEDITALKAQGVPLITTRGYVSIEKDIPDVAYYEKITYSTLRHWLILFTLSRHKKPMTFEELTTAYQRYNACSYSSDTLHKDLQELQKNKYIHFSDKTYTYKLTNKYNHYITPYIDDLYYFSDHYSQQMESTPNGLELKRFYDMSTIILNGFEDSDSCETNENYIVHGKRNKLDAATAKAYEKLNEVPYQARKLNIKYKTNGGEVLTVLDFSTGLVVYSVEKNRMYLLGELSDNKIIIAIDSIIDIQFTEKRNTIYNSDLYKKVIFNEMFSVSIDNLEAVEVLFDNENFIRFKIETLTKKRPDAKLTYNEEINKFVYTDKLRGMADFASYLRQFSRGAFALKPESLRKSLSDSTQRVIDNYKEVHHFE